MTTSYLEITILFLAFIAGLAMVNVGGDTQTFRDCAIRQEAKLVGNGTIECTVKKEPKQ